MREKIICGCPANKLHTVSHGNAQRHLPIRTMRHHHHRVVRPILERQVRHSHPIQRGQQCSLVKGIIFHHHEGIKQVARYIGAAGVAMFHQPLRIRQ